MLFSFIYLVFISLPKLLIGSSRPAPVKYIADGSAPAECIDVMGYGRRVA